VAHEPSDLEQNVSDMPSAGLIGVRDAEPSVVHRLTRPEPLRRVLPGLPHLRWPPALPSRDRFRSLPLRAAAIALLALAGLGLLTSGVVGLRRGARPHVDGTAGAVPPAPPSCTPAAAAATSARPDGCNASVGITGRTVTVGERRFELGQPGDVVMLGAWHCDGTTMPALLRPATGEVFVFDAWASPGHDVTVHPAAVVHGARTLQAMPEANGCTDLSVVLADGTTRAVRIPGAGS
jgi:hypothetical protein